ncbi:hypothetical protein P280DRAFT_468890 [Massarina eburnea CBS 473.64]|uniref:C-CAP/cofactor C-like domain-containing protein n=1 Tax=Massarina eburnea CBS 473.64 TaxID=1395130 RepID=A0A6A6S087_9PLEO|nr:hypothetical protein P280DRAFT_468890 [Massarina eburnea CBS 473.64]
MPSTMMTLTWPPFVTSFALAPAYRLPDRLPDRLPAAPHQHLETLHFNPRHRLHGQDPVGRRVWIGGTRPIIMASFTATAAPTQSDANLKERFFRYFQHEVTALQEQMARLQTTSPTGGELTDALGHCHAGIDRLSHEVKDASSYIPAYDQRTYAEAIKALSEKLQAARTSLAGGKKKFSFKTARKNESVSLADAAELARGGKGGLQAPGSSTGPHSLEGSSFVTTPSEEQRELGFLSQNNGDKTSEPQPISSTTSSKEKGVAISNHANSHIILPPSSTDSTCSGAVTGIRHSAINLSDQGSSSHFAPFANLMLKNIKESLIVSRQVAGPVHITGVESSVLVLACRQFRMHGSKNVRVYLHCSSRPIIEDCEGISFAPLPGAYLTDEIEASQNQWNQIDDFKWLKAEPSPHYNLMTEGDRVKEEVWKDTVPGGHSVSLDDILRGVGVL